jgi:hypothetical protein
MRRANEVISGKLGSTGAEATPIITESRRHKGYVIDLIYNARRWEAIIYPLSKLAQQLSPNLPPIHYETKEKAFSCKRIDKFRPIKGG